MFLYLYKNIIINIKLQMFPIATFTLGIFFILCNRDYGTSFMLTIKCQNKYQVY